MEPASNLPSDDRYLSLSQELDELRRDVGRQSNQIARAVSLLSKIAAHEPSQSPEALIAPQHFVACPLVDAALLRRIIRQRQNRSRYFPADLFADPAWDMLLDLSAAKAECKPVSVTSLCIASGVPMTTALRWIAILIEHKLIERKEDPADRRRVFVEITENAYQAMARYFSSTEAHDALPV